MNNKHLKTFKLIFENPVRSDIEWKDIEKMLIALGATVKEGNGSRVRLLLNDVVAVFHRPHPRKETDKGAVKDIRECLTKAGIKL